MGLIWLASYPKSGNTWVRMFLAAYLSDGPVDLNHGLKGSSYGDLLPQFYNMVSPVPHSELDFADQVIVRPAALAMLVAVYAHEMPYLVKTHHADVTVDDIALIPPRLTERAVYVVRDPRDVAVGYANHFKCTIDEAIESMNDQNRVIGEGLQHMLSTWSAHTYSWMTEERFPVGILKYEELHADTFQRFVNLLKFLEIDVVNAKVHRAIKASSFDEMRRQEKKNGFHESPEGVTFFRKGKVGGWKDVLTEKQEKRIRTDHMAMMLKLGYV